MASFWKKAAPYAAGALAGGVMGQFGATAPYAAAGSAAAGALANSKNRLAGAGQGFVGGGVGSAIGGGINGMMNSNQPGVMSGFGGGAMSGLKSYGNSIPGFGGIGTSNPTGMMAKFLTPQSIQSPNLSLNSNRLSTAPTANEFSMANGVNSLPQSGSTGINFNTTGATGAPASSANMANSAVAKKNLFSSFMPNSSQPGGFNIGQFGAGIALPMAMSAMAPKVAAPDFSSVTNPLKDRINNPSPIAQASQNYMLQTMNQPMGGSAESGLANAKLIADRQRAEDLRSLNQQFAASQPGSDYTNSSDYQRAVTKLNTQADQNYAAQAAQLQFQYDQQQKQNQMAAASVLQGMDTAQIQSLANLANLDVQAIMTKTGMDYGQAQALQQLAQQAGGYLMQSAVGVNKPIQYQVS